MQGQRKKPYRIPRKGARNPAEGVFLSLGFSSGVMVIEIRRSVPINPKDGQVNIGKGKTTASATKYSISSSHLFPVRCCANRVRTEISLARSLVLFSSCGEEESLPSPGSGPVPVQVRSERLLTGSVFHNRSRVVLGINRVSIHRSPQQGSVHEDEYVLHSGHR